MFLLALRGACELLSLLLGAAGLDLRHDANALTCRERSMACDVNRGRFFLRWGNARALPMRVNEGAAQAHERGTNDLERMRANLERGTLGSATHVVADPTS